MTEAVGAGAVTSGAMEWLAGLIDQEETVEKLHADLSKALADQQKRFLIVIDDRGVTYIPIGEISWPPPECHLPAGL